MHGLKGDFAKFILNFIRFQYVHLLWHGTRPNNSNSLHSTSLIVWSDSYCTSDDPFSKAVSAYTRFFRCAQKKLSKGVRSGLLGGHRVGPARKLKCSGAPICWKKIWPFSTSISINWGKHISVTSHNNYHRWLYLQHKLLVKSRGHIWVRIPSRPGRRPRYPRRRNQFIG